jgi:hypothetical protein
VWNAPAYAVGGAYYNKHVQIRDPYFVGINYVNMDTWISESHFRVECGVT